MITVMAAAMAMQKALIWSSSIISVADGFDELGSEEGEADGDSECSNAHDPKGDGRFLFDPVAGERFGDGGERADGIGDVVCSVGEAQERSSEDEGMVNSLLIDFFLFAKEAECFAIRLLIIK